jgi:RNA polymerase sigma-70 factor, ECF subfamily
MIPPDRNNPMGVIPGRAVPVTSSSLQLLRRARLGDAAALDQLLQRYLPRLRRWARGRLPAQARDLADTDDLVQDTFIKTLRTVGAFEPEHEGSFQAYLRQALANRIRDEIRRVSRMPPSDVLASDAPSRDLSPLEALMGSETVCRYEAALAAIRAEDREAIVARFEMDNSFAEVAIALNKPTANAARVAVTRAVLRLAKEMARAR